MAKCLTRKSQTLGHCDEAEEFVLKGGEFACDGGLAIPPHGGAVGEDRADFPFVEAASGSWGDAPSSSTDKVECA